jgi:hypothetical protein
MVSVSVGVVSVGVVSVGVVSVGVVVSWPTWTCAVVVTGEPSAM